MEGESGEQVGLVADWIS